MDLSHHLSEEAKRRQPSLAKSLYPIMLTPNLKSLGGGLPDPNLFPLKHIAYDIPIPPGNSNKAENIERAKMELFHGIPTGNRPSTVDLALAQQYIAGSAYPELLSIVKALVTLMHQPPPQAEHKVACTLGNTDGIAKMQRVLLNPGENMLFEEFSFSPPVENARAMGVGLVPVPMDAEGANPKALDSILNNWNSTKFGPKPRVFYMVTIGQNPTGSTCGIERIRALYKIAQKHDLIILEDDPYYFLQLGKYKPRKAAIDDSETTVLGIAGEPPNDPSMEHFVRSFAPTMISVDTDGRVVRFDSFSKIVFPASRTGWVTLNPIFFDRLERISEVTTMNGNGINQAMYAQLLTTPSLDAPNASWGFEGFAKWINHVRRTYATKRNLFLDTLNEELPPELGILSCVAPEAGMFVWMHVNIEKHPLFRRDENATPKTNTAELMESMFQLFIANGCLVLTGRFFTVRPTLPLSIKPIENDDLNYDDIRDREACLRATFAGDPKVIVEAIQRMAKVLKSVFEVSETKENGDEQKVNGHAER